MLGTLHREFFALIALIFMGLAFLSRHRPRIAGGVALARDLGNLPPNICTPDYLVKRAQAIGRTSKKLRVTALRAADLEALCRRQRKS